MNSSVAIIERIRQRFVEGNLEKTLHDDPLVSAVLCSVLDGLECGVSGKVAVIQGVDPLDEMSQGF